MYFVTGNKGKFKEASLVIPGLKQADLGVPEIQADTLEEVARFSIEHAYARLHEPCFVEDAGLFVHALKGFPGPYSKFVNHTLDCGGLLKLMQGEKDRGAYFEACIAYHDGKKVHTFTGRCDGTIALAGKGRTGFGFDPVFLPEGSKKTFAEDEGYKNTVSHRRRALDGLTAFLNARK